jgi:hypothetical protein
MYAYDDGEGTETTLRSNPDEVSQGLRLELQERLSKAGVTVDEARLTFVQAGRRRAEELTGNSRVAFRVQSYSLASARGRH